jgi:hypothetical protein
MNLTHRLAKLEQHAAAVDAAREAALDAAGDRMVRGDVRDSDVSLWATHYGVPAGDITAAVETVKAWTDEQLLAFLKEHPRP